MSGLHNKKNWDRFIELRRLISGKPLDTSLLKRELQDNYYQQRLKSLSDIRRHLTDKFEDSFFNRDTSKFFGTSSIKFSKRELTVTCYNKHTTAVYDVKWCHGDLTLRLHHDN